MSVLFIVLGYFSIITVVFAFIIFVASLVSKRNTHKASAPSLVEDDPLSYEYIAGYNDMAKANKSLGSITPQYVKFHALGFPVNNYDMSLHTLARKILDNEVELDIEGGRSNIAFMGGTDEQFNSYYKGGMDFIEDVEKEKKKILAVDEEISRRNRIAEERRAGLKEIDARTLYSMNALDELRQKDNPTASFDDQWNKLMDEQKEVE